MEKDVMVPDDMYEKYDLVTMFHLIEHITTPVDFLQKVASLIKPNGYLLMEMFRRSLVTFSTLEIMLPIIRRNC